MDRVIRCSSWGCEALSSLRRNEDVVGEEACAAMMTEGDVRREKLQAATTTKGEKNVSNADRE